MRSREVKVISAGSLDRALAEEQPRFFRDFLRFPQRCQYLATKVLLLGPPGSGLSRRDRLVLEAALADTTEASLAQLGRWLCYHLALEEGADVTGHAWRELSALGCLSETFARLVALSAPRWDNSAGRYLAALDDRHLSVALRTASSCLRKQRRMVEFLLVQAPERLRLLPRAFSQGLARTALGVRRYDACLHPLCELLLERGGADYESLVARLAEDAPRGADRVLMLATLHGRWPERYEPAALRAVREFLSEPGLGHPPAERACRWAIGTFFPQVQDLLFEQAGQGRLLDVAVATRGSEALPLLHYALEQGVTSPAVELLARLESTSPLPAPRGEGLRREPTDLDLEGEAVAGYRWSAAAWSRRHRGEPLAAGWLWAEYPAGGGPPRPFRTTRGGQLLDLGGAEVVLSGDVGLFHPVELSEEEQVRWSACFWQEGNPGAGAFLGRPLYWLDPSRAGDCSMSDWKGVLWTRPPAGWRALGSEEEGSWVRHFAEVDAILLCGSDANRREALERIYFQRAASGVATVPRGEDDPDVLPLGEVPPGVYSEVVSSLEDLTAAA